MSTRPRRRRAALLLALALASGGMAAAEVRARVDAVERRTGAPVPVVVATVDLAPGTVLGADMAAALELRHVPAAFVPPDALTDPAGARGLRLAAGVPRGGYVTAGAFASGADGEDEASEPGPSVARGERAVEVRVAGAAGPAGGAAPGGRVDVLVTTEDADGGGRTYVALEDVQLLDLRAGQPGGDNGEGDSATGVAGTTALATLRVAARDAAYLVAAQSFAREVRLLARPPGDRRPLPEGAVSRGDL